MTADNDTGFMTGVVTRMRAERRPAREAAMRALYQMDLSGCDAEWALNTAMEQSPDLKLEGGAREYAGQLVNGVTSNRGVVDKAIEGVAKDWAMSRMSPTDRNIMRIAVYEMMVSKQVPVASAIDEAVEIAKVYGSAESPRFVNGILGALAEQVRAEQGSASPDEA
jgi:N utilization substance protein B